jgi:outer membrane protein TolC
MTRAEVERRLAELAAEIEQAQTRMWPAEHQRETLRHELRRLINAESKAAIP